MVTKEELRFVEFWKEQREGSKFKYYLLYTISWGMLIVFLAFFIIMFLGGISIIPIAQDNYKVGLIVITGLLLGLIIAVISRSRNEKRYQKILQKARNNMN
ncbi:MAG: hypothetical protein ACTHMM_11070 [Agriterribacter sp.]